MAGKLSSHGSSDENRIRSQGFPLTGQERPASFKVRLRVHIGHAHSDTGSCFAYNRESAGTRVIQPTLSGMQDRS